MSRRQPPPELSDAKYEPETNCYRVYVTPELAQRWLDHDEKTRKATGHHNRGASHLHVNRLTHSIIEDDYPLTHQGAALDEYGQILDGQHRLAAIVKSGEAVWMTVFINQPSSNFEYLDRGRNRIAFQFLDGQTKYGPLVQAAARIITVIDNSIAPEARVRRRNGFRIERQSMGADLAIIDAWPELVTYAERVSACYRATKILGPPHLAIVSMASTTVSSAVIDHWLDSLTTGASLPENDPRLQLRTRFMKESKELSRTNQGYSLIVKAWNFYISGETRQHLRHGAGEPVPPIIGFTPTVRPIDYGA